MKFITELTPEDLIGRTILLRLDVNVPIKAGQVLEAFRLEQSLPTITYLRERGARVILVGHLGDDGQKSLAPVATYFSQFFDTKLIAQLADPKLFQALAAGQVVVLENIRRWPGEKTNDSGLAKQLAEMADVYVNEAFSVSHRQHASLSAITKYLPSYAGLLFEKEYRHLSLVLPSAKTKSLLVILGGVKFKTKIPLVKKFLKTADRIFITGALANSFFKASGLEVGRSVVEDKIDYIRPFLKSKKIVLPVDLVVKDRSVQVVKKPANLGSRDLIVDIGPETLNLLKEAVDQADLILWNGPVGWFEIGQKNGTLALAKIIAEAKAFSLVGGGDTLTAIRELDLFPQFGFVSTAGGAMLDFLASGTLPGIKALNQSKKILR